MRLGAWQIGRLVVAFAFVASPTAFAQSTGDVRTDAAGVKQVFVPAGCFQMGTSAASLSEQAAQTNAPDWAFEAATRFETPNHEVCLTQNFWIDATEVTNASFAEFVDDGGYEKPEYWSKEGAVWLSRQYIAIFPKACETSEISDHPRVCITFFEAEAYANWRGGRLPTEAEWEYAARGPNSNVYPWGNEWLSENAVVEGANRTAPVGSNPQGASWVGAVDMAGNAMEWVSDWLSETYYTESPKNDPQGPETGFIKAEKGGWWGANAFVARSGYKHFEDPPTYQDHHIGFRIVTEVRK